jgi:hypothetical protein
LGWYYFLLYGNDFPLSTQGAKVVLFADNTNILISEKMCMRELLFWEIMQQVVE